jgi:hypothetical protein
MFHPRQPREGTFFGANLFQKGWKLVNCGARRTHVEEKMDSIIYLVGLIVVIMAILSFFGLH